MFFIIYIYEPPSAFNQRERESCIHLYSLILGILFNAISVIDFLLCD